MLNELRINHEDKMQNPLQRDKNVSRAPWMDIEEKRIDQSHLRIHQNQMKEGP